MQVKGYKALAVPLTADEAAPFTAFVYVRQHSSKGEEGLPQGRTLFLANVPLRVGLDTAAYLRQAFGQYGEVEDVRLKERPARGEGGVAVAAADEALAVLQEGCGTRCAIGFVVFRTSKGLKAVLGDAGGRLVVPSQSTGSKGGDDGDDGAQAAQRLLKRFRARQPQVKALQAEVDAAMAAFEAAEAEEERRRKAAAEQSDADGFVMVTYGRKKRRRGAEDAGGAAGAETSKRKGGRSKRKKRKGQELQNFYAHQIREAKREQLARLRAKFEEDKARVERMKAARKFKPFG